MENVHPIGITVARPPSLKLLNKSLNATPGNMIYHGGRLLTQVRVKPIFWGPQWLPSRHPPISFAEVIWVLRTILFSAYMSGLNQYGGIQRGTVEPVGLATFDAGPSNPFTKDEIVSMLLGLLNDRIIPDPATDDQVLPCVFTPPGFKSDIQKAIGYHSSLSYHSSRMPFVWVGNDGTLEYISSVLSHELAEACTDPINAGFFDDSGACGQDGACEIADFCYGLQPGGGTEAHGGVWMQAYWSSADGKCIMPQEPHVEGRVSGNPSLIQGRFLSPGNFELVAPLQSGGIAHYSRVNCDPILPWAGPAVFATEVGQVEALSMIQSNYTAGANVGNLELVALCQGSLLAYWREDIWPYRWHGPTAIPRGGVNFRGNPVLIQGRFGDRGNFELIVPLSTGGMVHYSRANDDPAAP